MDSSEMREILSEVEFDDWKFVLSADQGYPHPRYFQVQFEAPDLVTGEMTKQHGRKWMMSKYMTKSEVVSTAFKAVITALEHEARESFRYKGRAIFGPHFDVDVLAELAGSKDNLDMRTGTWVSQP